MTERPSQKHNRIAREISERIARDVESFSERMALAETLVLAVLLMNERQHRVQRRTSVELLTSLTIAVETRLAKEHARG